MITVSLLHSDTISEIALLFIVNLHLLQIFVSVENLWGTVWRGGMAPSQVTNNFSEKHLEVKNYFADVQ